jgi:hypothetical protein
MIELVSNFLGAVKEVFGFGRVRLTAQQAAPMQARAAAATDAQQADTAAKTVGEAIRLAKGGSDSAKALEQLRKAAAE